MGCEYALWYLFWVLVVADLGLILYAFLFRHKFGE